MGYPPSMADTEVASKKFKADLDALWATGKPERQGWTREQLDTLTWRVSIFATRPDGTRDQYWAKLGADYYDEAGPTVLFIDPADNSVAPNGSRWLPKLTKNPEWFALHAAYASANYTGQLVCFSYNAFYEFTHGRPNADNCWIQGVHTVAAAIYRLEEALGKEYYECPSGP